VVELTFLVLESAVVIGCLVLSLRRRGEHVVMGPVATASAPSPLDAVHTFGRWQLLSYFGVFALFKVTWLTYKVIQSKHPEDKDEPVEQLQRLFLVLISQSQGLAQFLIFGLFCAETQAWYMQAARSINRRWREWMYQTEEVVSRPSLVLDDQMLHVFDDMVSPESGLMSNRYWGLRKYYHIMQGYQIVDWMVDTGRANTRMEAVMIGQTILEAGLLYHVTLEHNFSDKSYFYHADTNLRKYMPVEEREGASATEVGDPPHVGISVLSETTQLLEAHGPN